MKTTILFLFTLFFACHTQAQNIQGQVTDSLTCEPLVGATVTIHRGKEASFLDYAITDDGGRFSFKRSDDKNLKVSVTYLGYRKKTILVTSGKTMVIGLLPDAITLKEVTIKSGRISLRQDTIKYDLARFASGKDSNVKDVLKKLPGIDVDEQTGKISYQGKAINHFYVEGMDVTGGSYNQVNDNLKADAVESAEVIEHHQPIRSLRNKVPTENIALNLKLKPEARSKWIWNTRASVGHGDGIIYNAHLNALQLAKSKQGLYTYKGDCSGKDLTTELQQLTSDDVHQPDVVPSFVSFPAFSMPLEKHRLLDNDTHLLSLNHILRKDEIKQNRFSLRYLHDEQGREQGAEEVYYYPSDTIRIVDNHGHRLRTDLVRGDWDYEMNGERAFTRNVLTFQLKHLDALSKMQGDFELDQRIRTDKMEVENRYHTIYNKENSTWGIRSYLHYTYLPSSLAFGTVAQDMDTHQAYTDNQLYYLHKKNGWGFELTTGVNGRLAFLNQDTDFKSHRLALYARPNFSWERNESRIVVTPGVTWERYPNQQESKAYFHPRLYVRYRLSPRWSIHASASLQHRADEIEAYMPTPYYIDYRTIVQMKDEIGTTQHQSYMLYAEYKRPVKEFFWTLIFSHNNARKDYLTHSAYQGKEFVWTSLKHRYHMESYQVSSLLSKGFYEWNLKASLEAVYQYGKGLQAGQSMIQPYESCWLSLKPKINWTPNPWVSTSYQADITRSETFVGSSLPTLWNVRQCLSIDIGNDVWNLNLGGEHYYNELSENEHESTWLTDVSFQCNTGKWRWKVGLTNLFNQEEYRYTSYSDVRSYTSWMKMRPREILFSAQYQW